jgi:hypothetical protein
MCAYGIKEATVSIGLTDRPVRYSPPIGPSAKVTIAARRWQSGDELLPLV